MNKPLQPAKNPSARTLLLGIWGHLSRRRRIQQGLLLLVMAEVEGLSKRLTTLMIARRLSTVQRCDRVIRGSRRNRVPGFTTGRAHEVLKP